MVGSLTPNESIRLRIGLNRLGYRLVFQVGGAICGFIVKVQMLSAPELRLYSGSRSEAISSRSFRPSGETPFRTTLSGALTGSGWKYQRRQSCAY